MALTNRTVLLQVAPLLRDKNGRTYRRRTGVHLQTLSFHAAKNRWASHIARVFKVCRTERCIFRGRIFEIVSVSTDKLDPFSPHSRIRREAIHSYTRCKRSILTTLLVRGTSNAISPTRFSLWFLYVRHSKIWLRHPNDVRAYSHVVFWPRDSNDHFWGKNCKLWALVKSLVLKLDVSNFGILFFEW